MPMHSKPVTVWCGSFLVALVLVIAGVVVAHFPSDFLAQQEEQLGVPVTHVQAEQVIIVTVGDEGRLVRRLIKFRDGNRVCYWSTGDDRSLACS